jgi:hypothetical protein
LTRFVTITTSAIAAQQPSKKGAKNKTAPGPWASEKPTI